MTNPKDRRVADVINLSDHMEFKHCSYYKQELSDLGDYAYGVKSNNDRLRISESFDPDKFLVFIWSSIHPVSITRDQLAEFIHVAAAFLDSENRFKPTGQMVGVDYLDGKSEK